MSDINNLLWRPLLDGKQYDPLIPKVTCQRTNLGNGMTDHSVIKMAEWVKLYYWQTEKIGPLLKQRSLQETCNAIHSFAYDHFQYKADKADQYLRSPACSWHVRQTGIDCKSYSIIASCILTNLGISHYIRRIKQPGFMPDLWTHVYVIVPVDQKTGSLSKGHYTIDGTIAMTIEPLFTVKDDLFMKHIGLNGAAPQQGLGLSFSTVKGMFGKGWAPSCIGGVHDASHFDSTLAAFIPWFDKMVFEVNYAIQNNSPTLITLVNKFLINTQQIKSHSELYAGHNWDSKCSKDSTKAYKDLGLWYYNIVFKAFVPWLEQYFTVTYMDVPNIKRGEFEPYSRFTKTSFNEGTITVKNIKSITLKPSTTDIKRFEITPYVQDANNQSSFDFLKFVGGLTQTIASFKGNSGNTSNTGNGNTNTGNGNTNTGSGTNNNGGGVIIKDGSGKSIQEAGFGALGYVLLIAGVGIAISGFKNTPAKPVATTTTAPVAKTKQRKSPTKKAK